jgi:hypothetical protein
VVVDKTNITIPGVLVEMNNGLIRTVTDENGGFELIYPDTLKKRVIRLQAYGWVKDANAAVKALRAVKALTGGEAASRQGESPAGGEDANASG